MHCFLDDHVVLFHYILVNENTHLCVLLLYAVFAFQVRGDAKLFDFGLARFCPEGDGSPSTDTFEMSNAGSPR